MRYFTKAILTLGMFGFSTAFADTINVLANQVYGGKELYNESKDGKSCAISIQSVADDSAKGLHCKKIGFVFHSDRSDIPQNVLLVSSRITNYDRPEFPAKRTCAMNVNGTVSGPEIYGDDTSILYSQIFGGETVIGGTQYDYFLTIDPQTKLAVRARVHVTQPLNEYDVDCVNLKEATNE